MLYRRLRHPEGETAVDRRPHRHLVEKTSIDAHNRDDAKVSAAMDRLTKDMRTISAHEGRNLDAIPAGVEACRRFSFCAHRVDAGIGAAPLRQLHDAVVDVLFH